MCFCVQVRTDPNRSEHIQKLQNIQYDQQTHGKYSKFPKSSENVQALPKASECIRTYPNRSEQVRTGPDRSKNFKKLEKTSKHSQKVSKNFAKIPNRGNYSKPPLPSSVAPRSIRTETRCTAFPADFGGRCPRTKGGVLTLKQFQ